MPPAAWYSLKLSSAFAAVEQPPDRNRWILGELVDATIVVLVVVRGHEMVDVAHASRCHHGANALAVSRLARVHEERRAVRRDEQGGVSLVYVDVKDAETLR